MDTLFSPLKRGRLEVSNRVVLPPMATNKAREGAPTEFHTTHYGAFASAGVGTVIVEHAYVASSGRLNDLQLGIDRDEHMESWKALAGAIIQEGALAIVQITHAGGSTTQEVAGQVLAPSDGIHPRGKEKARGLTPEELEQLADLYVKAAKRAQAAGFDGVEIHGAHGYLLNQFLSPLTNRRTDSYGGSLENRARFPLEVTHRVREETDGLVLYRLGADDFLPGGFSLEEASQVALWLEEAGVDALDISGGLAAYPGQEPDRVYQVEGQESSPLYLLPLARGIRSRVEVPVIYTGGVTRAGEADLLIRKGDADLVGVGRAHLRDSGWAREARKLLLG